MPIAMGACRSCGGPFEKRDGGVYVLTDETQNGWLARLGALVMPGRMGRWRQRWLEGLGRVAGKEVPIF
jgi:hypothetical protein